MNILVPDSWLRQYLKTKATPEQIKEYLSLCGPSVERFIKIGKEVVYEMEVTSNRPDSMSITGIAREASAILPRFGIAARLIGDPYATRVSLPNAKNPGLTLKIKTDASLNPRWTSVIFEKVKVAPSPTWLSEWLELSGIRSLNNVIDITNFLMRAYGQPAHVFDFDAIVGHKMTLRASKKREKLITLDGKPHTLPGDDIVIADGAGKLIDLCGIMGGKSSSVSEKTTRVVLFLQTYDPAHIRRTSMALAHHTEAAGLFEKGLDPELVMPVFLKGVEMMVELTGGKIASAVTDIYPAPHKAPTISVKRSKVASYIGAVPDKEIKEILVSLGFQIVGNITVKVPSFRRDVSLDVDIIEELARLYGFHNIAPKLPSGELPMTGCNPVIRWEEEVKIRLRDWGYTELYTYSMISENLMDIFGLDKTKAYKITNPLSSDWVYMRPHLFPSVLDTVRQNLKITKDLKVFELSMAYKYRTNDLPIETPTLIVVWTGNKFFEAKGLAESIFKLFGTQFPPIPDVQSYSTSDVKYVRTSGLPSVNQPLAIYNDIQLSLGEFGSVGEINSEILSRIGIQSPVTRLYLDFGKLVAVAKPAKAYHPIPKYPPIVEDIAFTVPERFAVGPLIEALKKTHPLVSDVSLLDVHESTRTLHITYLDRNKNLTNEDIMPVREKIVRLAEEKFGATIKNL